MNRWDISLAEWEEGRKKWPLESPELKMAVYKAIRELEIQEKQKQYSYLESSLEPWEVGTKEHFYPHTAYSASISISTNIWDDPLVIAASYRCTISPGGKILQKDKWVSFNEHMQSAEVPGVLRELFLCGLFNSSNTLRIERFWNSFVEVAEKKKKGIYTGDEGWDIVVSPNGKPEELYYLDAKALSDSGINIGNLKEGKPKLRDILIAPVNAEWMNYILEMELEFLLDAEKFWDVTDAHAGSQVRLKQGEGKYVERDNFNRRKLENSKDNTQIDLKPRFASLLNDWPLLPLEPLNIGDITEECLNEEVRINGSKYQVRELYEPEHWL
jgi:hypothetical protein